MKRVDFILIGFCLGAILIESQALRDVRLVVPSAVIHGDDATLNCFYDMEGDQLYAVKWYLGHIEFFRYTPKEIPSIKQFPTHSGLSVRENNSNATTVVLEHVPRSISGRYTCEVSADAPSFYTSVQSAYLQVVDLPPEDPYISGLKTRYYYGEVLKANCTLEKSNPAANLTWYINGRPADRSHVHHPKVRSSDGQMQTARIALRLKISKHHFENSHLKIKCLAKMFDAYYQSIEKSIKFFDPNEKKRHSHNHTPVSTTAAPTTPFEPPLQGELAGTNAVTTLVFHSSIEGEASCASRASSVMGMLLAIFTGR